MKMILRKLKSALRHGKLLLFIIAAAVLSACGSSIGSVTFDIGNRLYPAFRDTVETEMNKEEFIGDTDYTFKTVEFYPHFAIVDSTKKIVSLSKELTNPAFKISIYKDGELFEDTWAFYYALIPHYARTSFLTFRVISFEYLGNPYGPAQNKENKE